MLRFVASPFLVVMILVTIVGNILVVLAVCIYRRMQTFPNILLTSLAISDLLVGLLVTPLALVDLLYGHVWPFGEMLCSLWATVDILLCTASILNLCLINLDRYMAISYPLRYIRSRSSGLAIKLIIVVWILSLLVCSPPWFIPQWKPPDPTPVPPLLNLSSTMDVNGTGNTSTISSSGGNEFMCGYTPAVSYRIYSAMGSFFIPLAIIIFVYSKIFLIVRQREKLMKSQNKGPRGSTQLRICYSSNTGTITQLMKASPLMVAAAKRQNNEEVTALLSTPIQPPKSILKKANTNGGENRPSISSESEEEYGDLMGPAKKNSVRWNSKSTHSASNSANIANCSNATAYGSANTEGSKAGEVAVKKTVRHEAPNKENTAFMRERKTLSTIGMVVSGFILCWLPFFTLYLIELALTTETTNAAAMGIFQDVFLWLGYSNSAINPLVYTYFNRDFRRAFKDILTCGCFLNRTNRSISVRRLHQSVAIV